jgi:hypothetical protein
MIYARTLRRARRVGNLTGAFREFDNCGAAAQPPQYQPPELCTTRSNYQLYGISLWLLVSGFGRLRPPFFSLLEE